MQPGLRWLYTSGTPGLTESGELPSDITGQAEIAWQRVTRMLDKANMGIIDIVKAAHYLIRTVQPTPRCAHVSLATIAQPRCSLWFLNSCVPNSCSKSKSAPRKPDIGVFG